MTLLCASDDLRYRTLEAMEGVLARLAYVAELRDEAGQYHHWGLDRIYGDKAAATAIAEVHTQLWLEVLRTPIPELHRQLLKLEKDSRAKVIGKLKKRAGLVCPKDREGGGARHFNSILAALDSLYRAAGENLQVA